MKPRTLQLALQDFDKIASATGRVAQPYLVDVFLFGAGDKPTFSGTMDKPDMAHGAVKMTLYQYGPGTDFGSIVIDIENIAAVRMRKPQ